MRKNKLRKISIRETQDFIGTVTSKGQVTIPIKVRKVLGLESQDKVIFRISDEKVELKPLSMTLEKTFGAVNALNKPENFEALRAAAVEEHAKKVIKEIKD